MFWPFKKQYSLKESGLFEGFTDWHSHILPCVDDGVQAMEESLGILRSYELLGVKSVWLTPHIMEDIPNTTKRLRERMAELQTAYTGTVELHLAAEYMLDNLFKERMEENDLLPLGENGDHLLVEMSYFNPPINLCDVLKRIKAKGYHPVLAHPERYLHIKGADYLRMKEVGVRFQLNLPSLMGMYGKSTQEKAKYLLKRGMYNYVGTDIHGRKIIQQLMRTKLTKDVVGAIWVIFNSSVR